MKSPKEALEAISTGLVANGEIPSCTWGNEASAIKARETAIANAEKQIRQQERERERVEKLKKYTVHHSDCRFLYPFDEKCNCGLAELEAE